MRTQYTWIREWDNSTHLVQATFLGHETVMAEDMVKVRYLSDDLTHIITQSLYYSMMVCLASNSDLNTPLRFNDGNSMYS